MENGTWKFELGGITLMVDDYYVKEDKHWLAHADKAIGFFYFKGDVYSISNQSANCKTAEDFYKVMIEQYSFFVPTALNKAS